MTERSEWNGFRRRVDDTVAMLFALVTEAIGWATTALLDQDLERAHAVIDGDEDIDSRCEELIGLIKERLSSSMLDPEHLEYLIAVLQIVPELERSADLAQHVAEKSLEHLGGQISPRSRGLIQTMSDKAVQIWETTSKAYRQRSRDTSFSLSEADDEIDELAARLVSEGTKEGSDPEIAAHLSVIARFYERIGDHAVNLSRRIDTMTAPRRVARFTQPRALSAEDTQVTTKDKKGGVRKVMHTLSRFRVVPRDDAFFVLFRSAAVNARECAVALEGLVSNESGVDDEALGVVRDCERRGDEITVDLLRRLDASFVTPYDREDIHALAEELDDVVDDMFTAASRFELAERDRRLPEVVELAAVVVEMTDEMIALINCLETRDGARFRLERIEHLERRADSVFQRGLATLFNGDYEPLEVIKLKDVLQSLENSCNAVEVVSDVVESILVKTS
ncbi:MAG: DUF47 family protein [Microthrixaceae bacterium]|nr:DUF47 family protein [Microthrixaceae bacterium]